MGIPGLTSRLINRGHWITMEPLPIEQELDYQDSEQSGQHPEQQQNQQQSQQQNQKENQQQSQQQSRQQNQCSAAILDGPGLAYYIAREYRQDNLTNVSTEFSPAYSEIGERAIKFLEDMEAVGLEIHAIYFDGVLPATKLATRKQRLEKTMKQLDEARPSMKSGKALEKKTPEPPFLVPAVLESIRNSKFGNRTVVVPAEADTYCADEAIAYESRTAKMATILTNDSDLLIQASGAQTRVMLLSSLTRSRAPDPPRVEANYFLPAKLAAAAGVDDLVPTAFFMRQDYHLSFDSAVAKAKRTSVDNNADFLAFQSELKKPDYSTSGFPEAVVKVLQQMDPRIAELAHQTMPGYPPSPDQSANVFLVPLLEDVGRFSAWESGEDIRHAAYSMTLSSTSNINEVGEYTRRGTTCYCEPHKFYRKWKGDLLRYMQMLLDAREFLKSYGASSAQLFNYFAMYCTISALAARASRGSRQPSKEVVTRVLARETLHSNGDKHVSAMCQATIYSLRILKQLLSLEKAKGGMAEELMPLDDLLGKMPTLAELFEKSAADTTEFWGELAEGIVGTVVEDSS